MNRERTGLLVTVDALAAELASDAAPVLLDVRWRLGGPPGIDSYRRGHLPGAVFADLDRDLAGPPGPAGRHPLPDPAVFQAAMRDAGVSRDRPVVVYDDGDGTAAARGWWTLRYFGHRDVRVLDGGYRAWTGAGLAVTTAGPAPAPGDFTAEPGHMPVLDAAGAQAAARTGLLLDARAGERYRGESEPVDPVAGHIPAPSARPPRPTSTRTAPSGAPPNSRPGSPPSARSRAPASPSRPTAARASPPRTRSSRSRWPACPRPCTSAPGPTGSPIPRARWRPARDRTAEHRGLAVSWPRDRRGVGDAYGAPRSPATGRRST